MQQKNTIICLLTQIWSACTDIIFCHFRPFFALLRHYWPQKLKFAINAKKALEILSFYTCVPLIKIIWCIVPEIWSATDRIFLSSWASFCPFTPLAAWKNENIKKWKHPLEISFYTSVAKIMIIHYTVPEICCVMDVIVIYTSGYKISKQWKKGVGISFYTSVPKIIIICDTVTEIWGTCRM